MNMNLKIVFLSVCLTTSFAFSLPAQTPSPSTTPARRQPPAPNAPRTAGSPSANKPSPAPSQNKLSTSVNAAPKLQLISTKDQQSAPNDNLTTGPKPPPLTAPQKKQILGDKTGVGSITLDQNHLVAKSQGWNASLSFFVSNVFPSSVKVGATKDGGALVIHLEPAASGQHFLVDCAVSGTPLNQFTINKQPHTPMVGLTSHVLFEAMAEEKKAIPIFIRAPDGFEFSSCEITLLNN